MANGFPENFESLSRLEALRGGVGMEIAFWWTRASELGDETPLGQAALEVLDYWTHLRRHMWSDDADTLDAIEAALRAARQTRFVLQQGVV